MDLRKVADLEGFWEGEKLGIELEGRKIILIHFRGEVRAFEDRCHHKGLPLSEGKLSGSVLICFAHHWEYDVCTGEGINPKNVHLKRIPVHIQGTDIFLDLDEVRTILPEKGN